MKLGTTPSPVRSALQGLWYLNVKTFGTAALWSISFWFVMVTHSLIARLAAIVIANFAIVLSSAILAKGFGAKRTPRDSLNDMTLWNPLLGTGFALALALENLARFHPTGGVAKIFFMSIFLSMLIIWLLTAFIFAPLRALGSADEDAAVTYQRTFSYLRTRFRYVFVSLAVLLAGWPIIFFYLFLALSFAQSLTIAASSEEFSIPRKSIKKSTNRSPHSA